MHSEAESGGFNVLPAWERGIFAQNVTILDRENNWNFEHEDLDLDYEDLFGSLDDLDPNYSVHHGTAVIGILAGQENEYGVSGMAVRSNVKVRDVNSSVAGLLGRNSYLEDGVIPDIRPGDVILIEVGIQNPTRTPNDNCILDMETETPTYCTLLEALPGEFWNIRELTDLGYIVVEGAANGGVNLADPEMYWGHCGANGTCTPEEESGAIIVAASQGGQDHTRPWWSNFGDRIHSFGWGYDVTTTGYGVDLDENFEAYYNDYSVLDDDNRAYTQSFNGTSSAAAQVAGSIALVQSFAKEHYKPMLPESRSAYLNADHMKELIDRTGTPGDDSGMGKKPDVGEMIDLVAQTEFIPELAMHNGMPFPKSNVVAGIRYDMDKDGRAELITFEHVGDMGIWRVDLSGIGESEDGFGVWDLTIELPLEHMDGNYFPVVNDYDSDEDADLAVYDNKYGLWYVYHTKSHTFELGLNGQANWDLVLDYSADAGWHEFARALPGDFDGDNYLDLAIMRADGVFSIDYGGLGRLESKRLAKRI